MKTIKMVHIKKTLKTKQEGQIGLGMAGIENTEDTVFYSPQSTWHGWISLSL